MTRELDAEVAEMVFGKSREQYTEIRSGEFSEMVHHYSESWDGAGLVVDEMRRQGFGLILQVTQTNYAAGFWKRGVMDAGSLGDSAPKAICRAAIAAKTVDAHEST